MTDLDARDARRRKLIGGGLAAVLAAVLIAIVVVRSGGEKVLNENGDALVLVGKDAGTTGTEDIDGFVAATGGCLGITGEGGEEATRLVVWPHGTTIETPLPLRISVDGSVYAEGQGISLSGQTVAALQPSDYFYDKVPESCRTAKVFVVDHG